QATTARIQIVDGYVYSGPGTDFYPVALLSLGATVELTGRRVGSWLEVVPPAGSFDWVAASAVKEQDDGTALVVGDGARAFIGSVLSDDARDQYQLTLAKGTRLQILDKVSPPPESSETAWYKVVPLPEEVRYVAAATVEPGGSLLEALPPSAPLVAAADPPAVTRPAFAPTAASPAVGVAARPTVPTAPASALPTPRFVVGRRAIPPAVPVRRSLGAVVASAVARPGATVPAGPTVAAGKAPVPVVDRPNMAAPPAGPPVIGTVDQRLTALNESVRRSLQLEPSQWDVPGLRAKLDELSKQAATPQQKELVAKLSEELKRTDSLRQKFVDMARQRSVALDKDRDLEELQKRLEQRLERVTPKFTAEGLLVRAPVQLGDGPTYALEDAAGRQTHYLATPAGMDLTPFVGSPVGVTGAIDADADSKTPVVNVVDLTPRTIADGRR
ncbi:MAG: hypothetical protein ACRC1K_01995, partial [Planctomycetia bacterium]